MVYDPDQPAWNAKHPSVPVDDKGNWQQYPSYRSKWEPVDPFYARLMVKGMYSGRSAKGVILQCDTTMKEYPMFISDLVAALQNNEMHVSGGSMAGYWTATKKGANFGVKFVGARLF